MNYHIIKDGRIGAEALFRVLSILKLKLKIKTPNIFSKSLKLDNKFYDYYV